MSLSLVEIAEGVDVMPTLDELVKTINREHDAVMDAAQSVVAHAILAGEALIQAKALVPHGQWEAWTGQQFPDRHGKTLRLYMRLARNADAIREANPKTITAAQRLIVGESFIAGNDELRAEARRLKREGLSVNEICAKLGRSKPTIYAWLDPKEAEKRRRRKKQESRRARRALHRQERDAAARKAGGSISHGYANVRKALEALTEAQLTEADTEAKSEIAHAIERLHLAEDHIVRASKLSVGARKTEQAA